MNSLLITGYILVMMVTSILLLKQFAVEIKYINGLVIFTISVCSALWPLLVCVALSMMLIDIFRYKFTFKLWINPFYKEKK